MSEISHPGGCMFLSHSEMKYPRGITLTLTCYVDCVLHCEITFDL